MRPFRFVHIADVHLDTPFASRNEALRERLREAAREAFRRAVDLALSQDVDAFLIAGDLFDGERLSFATERFLLQQLDRLHDGGVGVYYACGNHDPGGARIGGVSWPDYVTVFADATPAIHVVRDRDGQPRGLVSGAGHPRPWEDTNLVAAFANLSVPRDVPQRLPHVALVHAWVQQTGGADSHDRYAPCTVHDLEAAGRQAGIHYWALGHIHQRQEVIRFPYAVYPGNPQGRHFREGGEKGALLVTIHRGGSVETAFHPLAPIRWETVRLDDLRAVETPAQLEAHIERACRRIVGGAAHRCEWIWRIELAGPCPLAERLADPDNRLELEEHLRRVLSALHVEVRCDELTRPVDPDAYRGGTHPLAVALELLEQVRTDDALLDELTPLLARDGKGDGTGPEDAAARRAYVRSLLQGLEEEAVLRLTHRTSNG